MGCSRTSTSCQNSLNSSFMEPKMSACNACSLCCSSSFPLLIWPRPKKLETYAMHTAALLHADCVMSTNMPQSNAHCNNLEKSGMYALIIISACSTIYRKQTACKHCIPSHFNPRFVGDSYLRSDAMPAPRACRQVVLFCAGQRCRHLVVELLTQEIQALAHLHQL